MPTPLTFFFYDLETSGLVAKRSRIMQFAGQRTNLSLNPIGEPVSLLLKLSEDVLPDPDAILVTGITPQATLADGITEAAFLKQFTEEIAVPGTVFVGYNTIRFDDEFIRYLHYRNFYDPYEWQWQEERSKWDLLDVVRMTRALRPEGIEWPFNVDGKATNRLELLTGLNKLSHEHAHDALSDVEATIAVGRMIRNKQERLFDFLFEMRDKHKVEALVRSGSPFVYTSSRYPSETEKTTVVYTICAHPKNHGAFVYDLRYDPAVYVEASPERLAELWRYDKNAQEPRLPVKTLQYNHCPAIAPLGVLDKASEERLKLDMASVKRHLSALKSAKGLADKLCKAWEILEEGREQATLISTEQDVDGKLYDGFFDNQDKQVMRMVRAADPHELDELEPDFHDHRLQALLPLYKARNYPALLTPQQHEEWGKFCEQKLLGGGAHSRMAQYMARLEAISQYKNLTDHQRYLLEDLRLYGESIIPSD